MSDSSSSPSRNSRLLKLAGELANGQGHLGKEVADDELAPPSQKATRFGAAIKRTFQGFKNRSRSLGPSRPLGGHTTPIKEADDQKRQPIGVPISYSKSLSDVTSTQSIAAQKLSAPVLRLKRFSSFQQPPLSSVSEGVTTHHSSFPLSQPEPSSPTIGNICVPQLLQQGTPMTKVSAKKHQKFVFRLDADLGQIVWKSKKHKISEFFPFYLSCSIAYGFS